MSVLHNLLSDISVDTVPSASSDDGMATPDKNVDKKVVFVLSIKTAMVTPITENRVDSDIATITK